MTDNCRSDCVTEEHMSNTILTVSDCFKQDSSSKGIILALINKKSAIHQKTFQMKNPSARKAVE